MTDCKKREDLKPCPFCGAEWRFNARGDIFSHPRSEDRCPLEQTSIMNDAREVARWNLRPSETTRDEAAA